MRVLLGTYTTEQATGAWPNGARVRKTALGPGDKHPIGAIATIIGSIGPLPRDVALERGIDARYGYFLEWDATPGVAVFCADDRLEMVGEGD